jgi:hypothetical protein
MGMVLVNKLEAEERQAEQRVMEELAGAYAVRANGITTG